MQLGYQLGCQADVTNGLMVGLSAAIGPNAMVTVAPAPTAMIGGSAQLIPNLSLSARPARSPPSRSRRIAGCHLQAPRTFSTERVRIR
ncbi:MspA family porin [Nocardia sp. CA-129566]|uniref:MspA family porin n=1 Tax=Nocardia sp. CA-129566 TaxID=3239976 RepID=UPI003D97AB46